MHALISGVDNSPPVPTLKACMEENWSVHFLSDEAANLGHQMKTSSNIIENILFFFFSLKKIRLLIDKIFCFDFITLKSLSCDSGNKISNMYEKRKSNTFQQNF